VNVINCSLGEPGKFEQLLHSLYSDCVQRFPDLRLGLRAPWPRLIQFVAVNRQRTILKLNLKQQKPRRNCHLSFLLLKHFSPYSSCQSAKYKSPNALMSLDEPIPLLYSSHPSRPSPSLSLTNNENFIFIPCFTSFVSWVNSFQGMAIS
jgi:hypothetical protein